MSRCTYRRKDCKTTRVGPNAEQVTFWYRGGSVFRTRDGRPFRGAEPGGRMSSGSVPDGSSPVRGGRVLAGVCLVPLLGLGVDAGLRPLLRGDRRGRGGQRVVARPGLREGDHVADRVGPGEQSADPV